MKLSALEKQLLDSHYRKGKLDTDRNTKVWCVSATVFILDNEDTTYSVFTHYIDCNGHRVVTESYTSSAINCHLLIKECFVVGWMCGEVNRTNRYFADVEQLCILNAHSLLKGDV